MNLRAQITEILAFASFLTADTIAISLGAQRSSIAKTLTRMERDGQVLTDRTQGTWRYTLSPATLEQTQTHQNKCSKNCLRS